MDYVYRRLETDARFSTDTPQRKAFRTLLNKVIVALQSIEWVDSGDYGPGDENEAIEACLAPGATIDAALDEARKAVAELQAEIERLETRL